MKKRNIYLSFSVFVIVFILQGCIARPTPQYSKFIEESLFDIDNKTILLFNVRAENRIKGGHYLQVVSLEFTKDNEKIIYKCIYNKNTYVFIDNQNFANNLILVTLEPGKYNFDIIKGRTWQPNVIGPGGLFQLPIFTEIEVQPNKISYMGRIQAKMREKKDNEFSAGPVTPLLTQSRSGVIEGTFDISIIDAYMVDQSKFSSVYPLLYSQKIEKHIIPQWQRPDITHYDSPKTHFFW